MKTFKYKDGDSYSTFQAENAGDIVNFIRKGSWSSSQNDKEFLRKTAKMASMWSGKSFRYDSKDSFVKDLLSSGMLVEVSNEQNS